MRSAAARSGFRHVLAGGLIAFSAALVVVACSQASKPGVPVADLMKQQGELRKQTEEDVAKKSAGCISCHTQTDSKSMHESSVAVGCTDCHGGNAGPTAPGVQKPGDKEYEAQKDAAHVLPKNHHLFMTSANAERAGAAWLKESWDYVRFVNPGDIR